jgi:two-component system, OmpR family, alkaline phosphatase synthesis response regulator PhoP
MPVTGRILLIEDDHRLAEMVKSYLGQAGFQVTIAARGELGVAAEKRESFDAIILDLMLPDIDGLDVCRRVRLRSDTPILMLTARGDTMDRVVGLELGADDYLAKPFSPNELVARVRALLRRAHRGPAASPTLAYGPITIDSERHVVAVAGRDVTLTAKEFLLLEYLLQHRGRVLSRDVLLTDVWGYRYTGGTRTVDVHVRRLREKLPLLVDALITIKQFGYKLADPAPGG